jgi:integral membrane protein (TIGR01906 family)
VHLADVRWLFELNRMLLLVAVVAVAAYVIWHTLKEHGEWRSLASDALRASGITVGLLAVTGVVALVDFHRLFVLFHVISFDNPFWLLDPSTDYLVVLFPAGFWQDVGLITGALTGIKALFLGGTIGLLLKVFDRSFA